MANYKKLEFVADCRTLEGCQLVTYGTLHETVFALTCKAGGEAQLAILTKGPVQELDPPLVQPRNDSCFIFGPDFTIGYDIDSLDSKEPRLGELLLTPDGLWLAAQFLTAMECFIDLETGEVKSWTSRPSGTPRIERWSLMFDTSSVGKPTTIFSKD